MQKVTIVTINRNNSDGLRNTIESVICQTYNNYEYIIIDGNSTDSSLDVIKEYSDYITHYVSEPDLGIYDAMNKAIDFATGDWINFMNSGDFFYNKDVLSTIFIENKDSILDADVVYGNTVVSIPYFTLLTKPHPLDFMTVSKPFSHQSAFVKLVAQKKYKFDIKYRICADYNFFLILYKNEYIFKYVDSVFSMVDLINSYSANNTYLVVVEEFMIKDIHSKPIMYFNIFKKKFFRIVSHMYNILCKYNRFLLKLKKKKMEKNPDVEWVKFTN